MLGVSPILSSMWKFSSGLWDRVAPCRESLYWLIFVLSCPQLFGQSVDGLNPAPNDIVYALAMPNQDQFVVGGAFTRFAGFTGLWRLAEVSTNGSVYNYFSLAPNSAIDAVQVQTDGKLLVGGSFTSIGGQSLSCLARLNWDLSVDTNFNARVSTNNINCIAVQADGKILVGGSFTNIGATGRSRLARLNMDGSLDAAFTAETDNSVTSIALQPDGKILVGGFFSTLGGFASARIGRLNSDGSFDSTFSANANTTVRCVMIQPDGKVVVGGNFTTLSGVACNRIGRLNNDGSFDSSFNSGVNNTLYSLALQVDGKILVGGSFTSLSGVVCTNLGRVNGDGSIDSAFSANTSGAVYSLSMQGDGGLIVGGQFTNVAGVTRTNFARLTNATPESQTLSVNGSTITWLRSGGCPEVLSAMFEVCTNGTDFVGIGEGARIAGGWQLTKSGLPSTASIRVRGRVAGGQYDGSGGFAETLLGRPVLIRQPVSRTNTVATTAQFSAGAVGPVSVDYRWCKNGVPMTDGGNVFGANSSVLTLSNVFGPDMGSYTVVVSNTLGLVTSVAVTLKVLEPIITNSPQSQFIHAAQPVSFSVSAIGTAPTYQWRKNGAAVSGQTSSAMTIASVQWADGGSYDVVVSTAYGTATSAPAVLTVNSASADSFNVMMDGASVQSLAIQPDGRVLIGGDFTVMDGQSRFRLARVDPDGTLDPTFAPVLSGLNACYYCPAMVSAIAVQPDLKIVIGGIFTNVNGEGRCYIARLNTDGSLDRTFDAQIAPGGYDQVLGMALQPDGKIIASGTIGTKSVVRFNTDGSVDTTFSARTSSGDWVVALQPDGKVLVGGYAGLARLNVDGSTDTSFNANLVAPSGYGIAVGAVCVQPDGKILTGGNFGSVNGVGRSAIARLNVDGSTDNSFACNAAASLPGNSLVYSIALDSAGNVIFGGRFENVNGVGRTNIARVNSSGQLDVQFDPRPDSTFTALALSENGGCYVGGFFSKVGGQARSHVARLRNPDPASESLTYSGSVISWLRSGSCPELLRVSLDVCSNGVDWVSLANPTRSGGSWNLNALGLSANATIRARGWIADDDSWFVEASIGAPNGVVQPASRTNAAMSTASFAAVASGTAPLVYQWYKQEQILTNGSRISGAQGATLILSNVLSVDAGTYSVVISNAAGLNITRVATLRVIDPYITAGPISQQAVIGTNVTFTCTGVGTGPLVYEWLKDGVPITNANGASLLVTDVQVADAGYYSAVVSNSSGTATSSIALLTVNQAFVDSFSPSFGFAGGTGTVDCLARQKDGKILVGGFYDSVSGQTHYPLTRLNSDGTYDSNFVANVVSGTVRTVYAVAVQDDGKILIGGDFYRVNGQTNLGIARLNSDGSVDSTFVATATAASLAEVYSVVVTPQNQILMGGNFTGVNGQAQTNLARLNADGTLDSSFRGWANSTVKTFALQGDGKILVGGLFTNLSGSACTMLGRLNGDGTLDSSFMVQTMRNDAYYRVDSILVQPDQKIVVAGAFTNLAGQPCLNLGRVNSDGTLDTTFLGMASSEVRALSAQADRKIIAGGDFTSIGGEVRFRLARLDVNGRPDTTFNPIVATNGGILTSLIEPNGAVIVGGVITNIAGVSRMGIARLSSTDAAMDGIGFGGGGVTWVRGGTAPQLQNAKFYQSTNGSDWIEAGEGVMTAYGWQLSPCALQNGAWVRAVGRPNGAANGSGWYVESIAQVQAPTIQFTGLSVDGGQFAVNVVTTNSSVFVVESSSNLMDWTAVSTNVPGAQPLLIREAFTPGRVKRFFRAREP